MKRRLYVTRPGSLLRRAGHALVVQRQGQTIVRLPVHEVGRVVLWSGAHVTTPALRLLLRNEIDVSMLDGMGRFVGAMVAPASGSVVGRIAQFRRHADPEACLALSRSIVEAKCQAQAQLLRNARKRGAGEAPGLIEQLEEAAKRCATAGDLDTLRGIEGDAARGYFSGFGRLLRSPWTFTGRTRRPPRDPVNALLSLGYVLLINELRADLEARGLDPRVGFLHGLRPGRPALALDVVEPWRPAIDRLVLTVLNRQTLQAEASASGARAGPCEPTAWRSSLRATRRTWAIR